MGLCHQAVPGQASLSPATAVGPKQHNISALPHMTPPRLCFLRQQTCLVDSGCHFEGPGFLIPTPSSAPAITSPQFNEQTPFQAHSPKNISPHLHIDLCLEYLELLSLVVTHLHRLLDNANGLILQSITGPRGKACIKMCYKTVFPRAT